MKIEQLELTRENLWDLMSDPNVFLVKLTKGTDLRSKKGGGMPFVVGFHRLAITKFDELKELLESGKGAVVRITTNERGNTNV